jgi:hypothetical protein
MVEFHVLAGVETFIEQADALKDFTAISDGYALRRHVPLHLGVDE